MSDLFDSLFVSIHVISKHVWNVCIFIFLITALTLNKCLLSLGGKSFHVS